MKTTGVRVVVIFSAPSVSRLRTWLPYPLGKTYMGTFSRGTINWQEAHGHEH